MQKHFRLYLILLLFLFLVLSFYSSPITSYKIPSLGFSYSPHYAEYLGLDPRDAYLELLDSFDFDAVRIPVYWNRVYREGIVDFSEVDFLVSQAKERGLKVVLTFGYRTFRWPECYAPQEFAQIDYPEFETALLNFDKAVLGHFNPEDIDYLQVENEPFLHPHCRYLKPNTLTKIIEQIKYSNMKDTPVVITYGGAESVFLPFLWGVYRQADVVGASFYTRILDPLFRKFPVETYRLGPIPPRSIIREQGFLRGKGIEEYWVVEFQAEPWGEHPRTMSPQILKENWDQILSYGGADRVFLWGVEWWLKEKAQGRPQMFQEAQRIFNLPSSQTGVK